MTQAQWRGKEGVKGGERLEGSRAPWTPVSRAGLQVSRHTEAEVDKFINDNNEDDEDDDNINN